MDFEQLNYGRTPCGVTSIWIGALTGIRNLCAMTRSWKLLHATDGHRIKSRPSWIGFGQSVPPRLRDAALELVFVIVGVEDIFRGSHPSLVAVAEALAIAGGIGRGEPGGSRIAKEGVAAVDEVREAGCGSRF